MLSALSLLGVLPQGALPIPISPSAFQGRHDSFPPFYCPIKPKATGIKGRAEGRLEGGWGRREKAHRHRQMQPVPHFKGILLSAPLLGHLG